ncbi:hypothetical protein MHYP_G00087550 [Metynnis hypsauchen]
MGQMQGQDDEEQAILEETIPFNTPDTTETEVLAAKCHHNTACMSTITHAKHMNSKGPCLVCHHMTVPWTVMPLDPSDMEHVNLTISMFQTLTGNQTGNINTSPDPVKMTVNEAMRRGHTCICSQVVGTVSLGWSRCVEYKEVKGNDSTCMANDSLHLEQQAIRAAVIRHHQILDLMTMKEGGVCTILNASCCFYIPELHCPHEGHGRPTSRGWGLMVGLVRGHVCSKCLVRTVAMQALLQAAASPPGDDIIPLDHDQEDDTTIPEWLARSKGGM